MNTQVQHTTNLYHRLYTMGMDIYQQRHQSKLSKDDFVDHVLHKMIEEVLSKGEEIHSQHFINLAYWRVIDFLKQPQYLAEWDDRVDVIDDSRATHAIDLKFYSSLFRQLEKMLLDANTKEKTIAVKLMYVVKEYGLTKFLGVKLEDFTEKIPSTRQGKEHHVKKFKHYLSELQFNNRMGNTLDEFLPQEILDFSKDAQYLALDSKVKKLQYYATERKRDAIRLTKSLKNISELENSRFSSLLNMKGNVLPRQLFLALIQYLEASFYYREVCTWDVGFFISKYNYAFCQKRLGQYKSAKQNYLDALHCLDENKTSNHKKIALTSEALAELFFLEKDIQSAISYFQKARVFHPHDLDLHFGLLKCNIEINDISEIEKGMTQIVDLGKEIPNPFKKLVSNIKEEYSKYPIIKDRAMDILAMIQK